MTASRPSRTSKSTRLATLARLARRGQGRALRRRHHGQCAAAARAAARHHRRSQLLCPCRQHHRARDADRLPGAQWLCPHRHGARAGRFRASRRHRRSVAAGRGDAAAGSISSARRSMPSAPSMPIRSCRRARSPRSNFCRRPKPRSIRTPSRRFRTGYVAAFGPATSDDPLYEAVSAGRKHQGMEHWLPLFHEQARHGVRLSAARAGHALAPDRGRQGRALRTDRRLLRDPHAVPAHRRHRRLGALQAAAAGVALSDERGMDRRARPPSRARSVALPGAGIQDLHRCRRQAGPRLRAGTHRRQRQCVRGGRRPSDGAAEGGQARRHRRLVGRLGRAHGRGAGRSRPDGHPRRRTLARRAEAARRCGRRRRAGARSWLRGRRFRLPGRAGRARRPHGAPARPRQEGAELPDRSLVARGRRSRHPYRTRHRPLSRPEEHRGAGRAA